MSISLITALDAPLSLFIHLTGFQKCRTASFQNVLFSSELFPHQGTQACLSIFSTCAARLSDSPASFFLRICLAAKPHLNSVIKRIGKNIQLPTSMLGYSVPQQRIQSVQTLFNLCPHRLSRKYLPRKHQRAFKISISFAGLNFKHEKQQIKNHCRKILPYFGMPLWRVSTHYGQTCGTVFEHCELKHET